MIFYAFFLLVNGIIRQFYKCNYMSEQIEAHLLTRFKVIKKLGSGAYGHVFRVQDKQDNKIKALKKNFDAFTNTVDAQRTYREIMFLLQLKHPNIITLQEVLKARNGKDIYLLFQHMDADLYEVSRAKNLLTDKHRKYILYQIAKAIYYIHRAGLIHRDLKPSNVLINQECDAKVCDFGLVRTIDEQKEIQQQLMTEYIATRWYRAPQIILGSRHYSKAIDVWSFGCLMAEVFNGKPLFPGNSTLNQIQRVLMWTGIPTMSDLSSLKTNFGKQLLGLISTIKPINKKQVCSTLQPVCFDLLMKTLQFNCEKRITIEQVLKHPYFAEFYRETDMPSQVKKVKVSVKDDTKLNLKQYRSLIYEQISKHNTRSEEFSISKVRTRSLKTEQSYHASDYESRKSSSKKLGRCVSNEHQQSANEDIKTIKKTDVIKKKNYFDEWQRPNTRGPNAQKKLKQRVQVRKNPYYKSNKGTTPGVRMRRWAAQSQNDSHHQMKSLSSNKNVLHR